MGRAYPSRPMLPLVRANLLLVALLGLHTLDHAFWQPARDLGVELTTSGLAGSVAALAVLALALGHHPLAAPAAVAVGFGTAIGFLAAHALPRWSAWSDPYPEAGVNALSWVLMLAPAAVALCLGVLGWRLLRTRAAPV